MKILLQNVQTKLYFTREGVWTANANTAHDFGHSNQALDFARKSQLTAVQVVVKFEGTLWDEIVPLPLQVATLSPQLRA